MKIATWNVNSIKIRLERLLAWLPIHSPDVVCLQETKSIDENFPEDALREAGYHTAYFGQKTYNGVAILSRKPLCDVQLGLAPALEDPQARFVSADVEGVRVLCAYVPNGSTVDSDKYAYKQRWLRALDAYLESQSPDQPLVLCGDLNIAPDDLDVAKVEAWKDSVLCHHDARQAFERLLAWGLTDVVRRFHPEGGLYSWWDYRQLAFPKNDGLRIDHILATEPLAALCTGAYVDRDQRKGKQPSDHAPVVAEFNR